MPSFSRAAPRRYSAQGRPHQSRRVREQPMDNREVLEGVLASEARPMVLCVLTCTTSIAGNEVKRALSSTLRAKFVGHPAAPGIPMTTLCGHLNKLGLRASWRYLKPESLEWVLRWIRPLLPLPTWSRCVDIRAPPGRRGETRATHPIFNRHVCGQHYIPGKVSASRHLRVRLEMNTNNSYFAI